MLEGVESLTQFDVTVIVIVLLSSVLAFLRGFIKEFFVLLGWIGAAAITLYTFPFAADFMRDFFKSSKVVNIAAVTLVFFAVLTFVSILNAMILDSWKEARHGLIDRSLGFLFGMLRGLFIASIVHFAIVVLHDEESNGPDWLQDGQTFRLTQPLAEWIQDHAKDLVKDGLDAVPDAADDLKDKTEEQLEDAKDAVKDSYEDYRDNNSEKQ